eukprot:1161828-Pelagomonas_calceolata.AAC.5
MAGAAAEPLESLSLIGRGLTSCSQVPELQLPTLASVCLHGNDITSTEGISHLTRLQHLNLSSNAVDSLEGVQGKWPAQRASSLLSLEAVTHFPCNAY